MSDEFIESAEADFELEEPKPTSIKTVGIVIIVLASIGILSCGLGALTFSMVGSITKMADLSEIDPAAQQGMVVFQYYGPILFMYMIYCIGLLIGGINFRKYKRWAGHVISISSGLVILTLVISGIYMIATIEFPEMPENPLLDELPAMFQVDPAKQFTQNMIGSMIGYSIPFGILIWFVNRKKTQQHLE